MNSSTLPANDTIQASSTDLDVVMETLGGVLVVLGGILLLLLAAAACIGAGMLTGKLCTHLRGRNWTKDEYNLSLSEVLSIVNAVGFCLIGAAVAVIQLGHVHDGRSTLNFVGSLGIIILIELVLTLIVGVALVAYIAIERALRKHTEENDRLHETRDDNDEENVVYGKDRW